jgi:HK97 family phage portal protein
MGWRDWLASFTPRHDRAALTLSQLLAEDAEDRRTAGEVVNADSALRLSAVWGCVRLLCDVVSTLPLHAFRAGSREPLDPPPVLLNRPSADLEEMPEWLWAGLASALLRGDTFGLIVARAGASMRPAQIELLHPDRIGVKILADRSTEWRLDGRRIEYDDLWHLRGYPFPGNPLGLSPIAYAAGSIGLGLAAQKYGGQYFADAATPSGILVSDQFLTDEQAGAAHERWMAMRRNRRDIAVLGGGTKFQPISIAPEESQFLETQKFTVAQICRIFAVPPEMVASESGASLTYANVEQRDLSLLKYAAAPWLTRFERKLTRAMPRGTYVKFNAAGLLRTDTLSRYQAYELGLKNGFMTVEQIRELEDWEPIPAGTARPQLAGVA